MSDTPRSRASRHLSRVASFVGRVGTRVAEKLRNVISPMDTSPAFVPTPPEIPPRPYSVPLAEVDAKLIAQRPNEFDLGDGVPRQLEVRTNESPFILSDGTPCILTSHETIKPTQGTLEYIQKVIVVEDATRIIAAAKSKAGGLPNYGESARQIDSARVDQSREELLDLCHTIVRPFVCLTSSSGEYNIQYKEMGAKLGKSIRSAINNLATFAKSLPPQERWYKANLLSSVLADGAVARFPLDSNVNARIPDKPNHMTLEAFKSLPGDLDLDSIRLTRNNTLTEWWNGGLNLRQIFLKHIKGTYTTAEYGPDMMSCQTALQYLDRLGFMDYLIEQAKLRLPNIVEARLAAQPSADYVLRALRHSVNRSDVSKDVQDFSLFFSRLRLIAARDDVSGLHPNMFPTVDLEGEFQNLDTFNAATQLSPPHAALIEISRRIRDATRDSIRTILSEYAHFSPSELEKIAKDGVEAQMKGSPYSPIRSSGASEGITSSLFTFASSATGAAKESDAQVAAEIRVDIKKLSEEYEKRPRGVSEEPLPPRPANSTTIEGGILAIAQLFEHFLRDPKTPQRLKMAFRVVKELQGGPKRQGDKSWNSFSLQLAICNKSRSTARAFKNMHLLGAPLGLEFIEKTLLFLALSLVFPDLNALTTVADAVFQDLYDRGCAHNSMNRVVGSEILKDLHGAIIAFGCYTMQGLRMKGRGTIPADILKDVGQIDPRYYPFLLEQQGQACMMHRFCGRSLVYDPRQRPLLNQNDRAIGVGVNEPRTTLSAMVLHDDLPLGRAYPCLYQLFAFDFNLPLACLISYFAYLFHWADKFARGKGRLPAGAIGSEQVLTLADILMDQETIGVVTSGAEDEDEDEEMDISRVSVITEEEVQETGDLEMGE
ncbi:hypothetical protein JCM3765_006640 [Sporobolomyces pararoseus]